MIRKKKGSIIHYLPMDNGEDKLLNVYYIIIPGKNPPDIEVEIYDDGAKAEVDDDTVNIIINLCLADSEGNPYDKYNDD